LKNLLFIIVILFSFAKLSIAQKSSSYFNSKKNQHSISAEYISLSYTYIHLFAPRLQLGARIQAGLAHHIKYKKRMDYEIGMTDIFNLQILYRLKASNHFYIDMGFVYAYNSFIGSLDDWQGSNYGLVAALYYNYRKLHIGFSFQYRTYETEYYYYTPRNQEVWESEYNNLFVISPLIIGISF
jgi:hypothetical protein